LGYIGLADLFVLAFFGPVALAGTYYVQTLRMSWMIILAGIPFGMISTAILDVNNLRDIITDAKSGKKTLAVRYGRTFARWEYVVMLVGAAVIPAIMVTTGHTGNALLLPVAYVLFIWPSVRVVFTITDGKILNDTLAATGRLLIIYGLLFALGWLL
jgi:1,4-dihydroxy-2-naphthoate octaprenyltransferase